MEATILSVCLALCVVLFFILLIKYIRLKKQYGQITYRLKNEVYKDMLTDLFNRRYFVEYVAAQLTRTKRTCTPVGLIMIDIDCFKKVNDTYGHAAGDMVLKNFADQLKNTVRGYDAAVRYGGDEFAVFLPDVDDSKAKISAERIRSSIENLSTIYNGNEIKITCSLGISSAACGVATVDELIEASDKALYEAKSTGRNRICLSPPIISRDDNPPERT